MSARETTTVETPTVDGSSDQESSQLTQQAALTEYIKSIEDDPAEVDVLRKGVISESGVKPSEGRYRQSEGWFAVVETSLNGVTTYLKIKFDSSRWGLSEEELLDLIPDTIEIESDIDDDGSFELARYDDPTETKGFIENYSEMYRNYIHEPLILSLPIVLYFYTFFDVFNSFPGQLIITLLMFWVVGVELFSSTRSADDDEQDLINDVTLVDKDTNEDIFWSEDIRHTPTKHTKVTSGDVVIEDGSGVIKSEIDGDTVEWKFDMENDTILTEPYHTLVRKHRQPNEELVLQANPAEKNEDLSDDVDTSECGEWVLLPR